MSHIGGGELLRAVMTANAVDSRPFFYTTQLTGSDPTPPGGNITTKNAVITVKEQTSFLMTSIFGLTSSAFVDQSEFIDIFDPSNSKPVADNPLNFSSGAQGIINAPSSVYAGFFGDTLHSCVTLPNYVLWTPNSLIGIAWTGHNQALTIKVYRYLILAGIEYKLKD